MIFLQRYTRKDYEQFYAKGYWTSDHLLDRLAAHVAEKPDAPAVIDCDEITTWSQLDTLIDDAAQTLSELGIGAEDIVGVQLPNSLHLVVAMLALLKIGAVYNPVNPSYRLNDVKKIYRATAPKLHIFTPNLRSFEFGPMVEQLVAEADGQLVSYLVDIDSPIHEAFPRTHTAAEFPAPDPDAIYLLGSTSGSTGDPKIFMHTQNTQFNEARFLNHAMGLTGNDFILAYAPMTHRGVFMWGFMQSIAAGAALVIQRTFDPEDMIKRIDRFGVTSFFAIPNQVVELLNICEQRGSGGETLRVLMMGGAPVPPGIVTRLRAFWPNCAPVTAFGTSETGYSTVTLPDYPIEQLQTCGKPLDGMEITVDRSEDPDSESGEVLFRGPLVFAGYYGNQSATSQACDRDGWFRTGDRGYVNEDGNVIVTGRSKNVIIRSGLNIQAEEVEALLLNHKAVAHVVLVARNDPKTGERAIACVSGPIGAELDLADLTAHLDAADVAKFKWPEGLVRMEELPLNAIGKYDRIRLREIVNGLAIESGQTVQLSQTGA